MKSTQNALYSKCLELQHQQDWCTWWDYAMCVCVCVRKLLFPQPNNTSLLVLYCSFTLYKCNVKHANNNQKMNPMKNIETGKQFRAYLHNILKILVQSRSNICFNISIIHRRYMMLLLQPVQRKKAGFKNPNNPANGEEKFSQSVNN